jgi:hypothetical protein
MFITLPCSLTGDPPQLVEEVHHHHHSVPPRTKRGSAHGCQAKNSANAGRRNR